MKKKNMIAKSFKTVDRNVKGCHNWQLKGDKFKL